MTAKLGFVISAITALAFFAIMTLFIVFNAPSGPAAVAGVMTFISVMMTVVCGCKWYEDTKRERRRG